MSSLSPKDRVSLCRFTFADGRRCRTPRSSSHPHFCYDHAQKEARAFAADKLGKDLAYFFSGDYLSACDLSTALARLIPAVVRGEVKPRAARTVAYLAQTLMQAIHISQHEYCEAFSSDAWRKSIRSSVKGNLDYRFPPDHEPGQPKPSQPQSAQPHAQASTPIPTPVAASAPQPTIPQAAPAPPPAGSPTNQTTPPPAPALSPAAQPPAPANQAAPEAPPSKVPPPAAQTTPQSRPNAPHRDPYAVHFDYNYRLRESPKPF